MMKTYKIFAAAALILAVSCTDQLRQDVDALRNRVEDISLRIQQLNDNLNIVRVALDGNCSISSYTEQADGSVTLVLSDGRSLTVTQGIVGGNFPSVVIGSNGNWVIAGEDSGVRALTVDGKDATITPKFKIEPLEGLKTWFVSYDDGANWEALGSAEGENTTTNFFDSVGVVGNEFRFTFSGSDYVIPVLYNLSCVMERPETMVNGVLYVDASTSATLTLTAAMEEGDLLRTIVPDGWTCTQTPGADATHVLRLTAPDFSSEGVLRVEVCRGVNSASDCISIKSFTGSYWSEYVAGLDVPVGNMVINRYSHPGAVLVTEDTEITETSGVYFVQSGVTLTTNGLANLIVIGTDQRDRNASKLLMKGNSSDKKVLYINTNNAENGLAFSNLNISFDAASGGAYYFNITGNNQLRYLYFDGCDIKMGQNRSFSYFSSRGIADVFIKSCRFSIPKPTNIKTAYNIVNLRGGVYSNILFENNILHCSDKGGSVIMTVVTTHADTKPAEVNMSISRNTLMNVFRGGIVNSTASSLWKIKNNMLWHSTELLDTKFSVVRTGAVVSDFSAYDGNRVFATESVIDPDNYTVTYSTALSNAAGEKFNNVIPSSTDCPFEDGYDETAGRFVLKSQYKGIGAEIID